MNIYEWLEYGRTRGWCSEFHCDIHNGAPITDEEAEALDRGDERCCYVVRIFEDALTDGD